MISLYKVEAAVESIPQTEHAELTQVGRNLIVMRKDKDKDDISLTKFSGSENIRKFSHQIRFKYGMFEDHMPWGYGSLFTSELINRNLLLAHIKPFTILELGTTEAVMNIDLAVLDIDKEDTEDTAKTTEEEQQVAKALNSGLYPDLTSMME